MTESAEDRNGARGRLIYRQSLATRLAHWTWAVSLFFLLPSGLQIFNAHPVLYLGEQSGFGFDNAVVRIGARDVGGTLVGYTEILYAQFDTTGVLGLSGPEDTRRERAFPSWATIPSGQGLATGRVVHFFFAWLLVVALLLWLAAGIADGHVRRDLVPRLAELRALPRDIADHARLRFHHSGSYNVLQKLAYGAVLFMLLPLMVATGLAMSPAANALLPWLTDLFGGRQSARSLHFLAATLLTAFFIVHIAMVVAAGPLNELRSIVTGWYRTDPRDLEGDDHEPV